ncbi:hypothetical protein HN858_02835 [Candidatus Falkowbacteria bacterium]|jgi:ABC-type Fe3+ transport system permease subunit|nr:hypothetical protein [Candidatus Falkowbacteria bacterium]MBT6574022.1 hypothetical protein [Candidatus Falkowbacteria bacterium]MBT7348592.1 hypothetical protein [Candidatus Falkowbacteria bacterium]MBT7500382.1 hypothetical protein [Candidatus Falkowbacteria bacterium]
MKKNSYFLIVFILLIGICFLAIPNLAIAGDFADGLKGAAEKPGLLPKADNTIEKVIGQYIGVFFGYVSIAFLIMIVYGGIMWMTAGGTPQNVEKARKTLIHAAIGLVVTLMAYQLTAYVIAKISGTL